MAMLVYQKVINFTRKPKKTSPTRFFKSWPCLNQYSNWPFQGWKRVHFGNQSGSRLERSWCKSSWLTIFATTNGIFCSFFSFTGSYLFGKPKNRYTARWFNSWPFFINDRSSRHEKPLSSGHGSASQKGHQQVTNSQNCQVLFLLSLADFVV